MEKVLADEERRPFRMLLLTAKPMLCACNVEEDIRRRYAHEFDGNALGRRSALEAPGDLDIVGPG
jgi:hypothetical protein